MIDISVVIPTYNRQDLLAHTLRALTQQTLNREQFEVIVVDDGGHDDSQGVVESFTDRLNIRYAWQPDLGFRAGKARNVGTMMADGQYIVYIDCGVLLSSTALEGHLKQHRSRPHPIAMIGYVYGFDLDSEGIAKMRPIINNSNVDTVLDALKAQDAYDIRQQQYDILGNNIADWPAPFDLFWTCHVSAERSELIKAGLFDESFNTWGGEDVDLAVRLFINNNMFVMKPDICSFHWPHPKEVQDYSEEAKSAAARIHQKYQLWQTSFYNVDLPQLGWPLNRVIHEFQQLDQQQWAV
ncbi:Validoxylamine A glucosyltransferase [Vibrio stylophorae]|uniref:Validoxylamine A glucosyltransferase n=1 Tax=Vibrio stylophorae TaxID=659351 RepID=A0ABM8ZQ52_9VIBR|nr:glycosyltransferase [Vibrio stylophorae]CAH0532388.1 Validoxylamine A glucosyltransferase [Vibrio stylophorae]